MSTPASIGFWAPSVRALLRAKLYFDLHRECVSSDLTGETGRPFAVSPEEVHDDETFTAVLDVGEHLETARQRLDDSPQVSRVEASDAP